MGRQQTQHSLMIIPKVFNSLNSTGYTFQQYAIPQNHKSFDLNVFVASFKLVIYRLTRGFSVLGNLRLIKKPEHKEENFLHIKTGNYANKLAFTTVPFSIKITNSLTYSIK